MKKEEILEKSRKSNMDEREEKIETKSDSIGMWAMLALLIFYLYWRIFHNMDAADIESIISAQIAASCLYKYRQKRDKKIYLIFGLACTFSTICLVVVFIIRGAVILK